MAPKSCIFNESNNNNDKKANYKIIFAINFDLKKFIALLLLSQASEPISIY